MAYHAIISGGSSGIGLALANMLARSGWNLTLLARQPARLEQARAAIASQTQIPVEVELASADVRDEPAVRSCIERSIARLGAPSLVVTSAGIVIPGVFVDLSADDFRVTMDVNYFGTINVLRSVLPSMRESKSGRIVLVSSGAGLLGLYGYSAYAPSKFAVRGLAEALRGELKPEGIEVSIVYPPDTDTPQLREEIPLRPEATSKIAGGARVRSADEVAEAILTGIRRKHFVIAPGWEMSTLARLHSVVGPLLNKYSFDPIVARTHAKRRVVSP